MKDLSNVLTVFVISCGENPNYNDCISALNFQSVKFKRDVIKNYHPMSMAFQEMQTRCTTPYYVQVDEDMILANTAIEFMYNAIKSLNNKTPIVAFRLRDVHFNMPIYGIKIYNHNVFKNYPYNLECRSCEIEQLDRMKKDGYSVNHNHLIVGQHSPKWNNELIFERYFDLMEKYKKHKYDWLENLIPKLWGIIKKEPTQLNMHALPGAYTSILNDQVTEKEKDYTQKLDAYKKLEIFCNE